MNSHVLQVIALLDEAYNHQAWHGPNLKGSIRGVDRETALWRPGRGRHNIWEVVLHTAYWKYTVRRRLTGEKRGSFALKGSNWFLRNDNAPASQWRSDVALLEEQHQLLREIIAGLQDRDLNRATPRKKVTVLRLVQGIAAHDLYHAGQIQLLKRLAGSARRS